MTILLVGGGSGGHITPLLAVAHELKRTCTERHISAKNLRFDAQRTSGTPPLRCSLFDQTAPLCASPVDQEHSELKIVYFGERGGRLKDIAPAHTAIDESYQIFAGKLRRYHTEGLKQLLDIPTLLKNLRDVFLIFIGFAQALWRLWRLKPDAIFIKGGFVGVPIGLAAAILGIPYVTHDSDSTPGLANRIIARWAAAHAVAMPKEFYRYPKDKTYVVGVPLAAEFVLVSEDLQRRYRQELHISDADQVVFITGGGLGAARLNAIMTAIAEPLLTEFPKLYLLHGTGRGHENTVSTAYDKLEPPLRSRIIVRDFIADLYRYSGAADIVITRGGGSALAEFAAQGKACIVLPNPLLTNGHQLKNAAHLDVQNAVVVANEDELVKDPAALIPFIKRLLQDPRERSELGRQLHTLSHPDSAASLADILLSLPKDKEKQG